MLRCKSSNLCLWSNHFELEERFKNAFNFLWCNEIKFYQQSKKCKVLKMCKEKGGWLSKVNKNEFSYDIFVSFEKVFLMTLKVSTNKFLLLIRFALCTWNLVLQFKKIQTIATNLRYCQRKMNFCLAILLTALMWLDCHNKEDLHKTDEWNYTIGLKYWH